MPDEAILVITITAPVSLWPSLWVARTPTRDPRHWNRNCFWGQTGRIDLPGQREHWGGTSPCLVRAAFQLMYCSHVRSRRYRIFLLILCLYANHLSQPCIVTWVHEYAMLSVSCFSATCLCIPGAALLGQLYMLPHWDGSRRSKLLSHRVSVYRHRANQA